MKHIILTLLVCLNVAAFSALYRRTTEIVVQTLLEGLSQISCFYQMLGPARFHQNSIGYRRA